MVFNKKIMFAVSCCAVLALIATRVALAIRFGVFWTDEYIHAAIVKGICEDSLQPDTLFNVFFVKLSGNFSSLTFYGPAIIWAWFFGSSMPSLRLFTCLITIGSVLLLARTLSFWYKDKKWGG